MSIESALNFRRIDDRLTTSGSVAREDLERLRELGYEAVINLLPDDSPWAVEGEAAAVQAQGIDYVHIPVDFAHPSEADLTAFTLAMDAHKDRSLHVHCAANYRVSVFYALYALRCGLWSAAEAEAHIRSIWDVNEHPAWAAFVAAMIAAGSA